MAHIINLTPEQTSAMMVPRNKKWSFSSGLFANMALRSDIAESLEGGGHYSYSMQHNGSGYSLRIAFENEATAVAFKLRYC